MEGRELFALDWVGRFSVCYSGACSVSLLSLEGCLELESIEKLFSEGDLN